MPRPEDRLPPDAREPPPPRLTEPGLREGAERAPPPDRTLGARPDDDRPKPPLDRGEGADLACEPPPNPPNDLERPADGLTREDPPRDGAARDWIGRDRGMDRRTEGGAELRDPPEREALGMDTRELLLGANVRLPPPPDDAPEREIDPERSTPDRLG